jgi:hypothetical protein
LREQKMCLWCPDMSPLKKQSGMTLVLTLLLLLSLLMMASAITYITMSYANLADSVTHKPLAIDAAETCIDKGFEWLSDSSPFPNGGSEWVKGVGSLTNIAETGSPLFGYSVITDTSGVGSAPSLNIAGRTRCNSVTVEKLAPFSVGTGAEIGSKDYASSTTTMVIRIQASGLFDVPLLTDGVSIDNTQWRPNSSQAKIEVVGEFTP